MLERFDAKVVVKFRLFFIGFDDEIDLFFIFDIGWEKFGKDFPFGLDIWFEGMLMSLSRNT